MFWVNTKRILKSGLVGFWRNGFVSFSAVIVMIITLFVVGSLIFNNILLEISLNELKEKVDINVYFTTTANEEEILGLKDKLSTFPEIANVEYVSAEESLASFKAKHESDQLILQALEELGENPLGARLNIKAREPSQYEGVAEYLKQNPVLSKEGVPIIDKVNYFDNKTAIDKLNDIITSSSRSNLVKMLVLIVASIVVTFNTIRLAIYISKEEISVMRLVGASNTYIRGPFVVAGLIYGGVSAIVALVLFYPVTYVFGPLFYPLPLFLTHETLQGVSLFKYYIGNLGELVLVVLAAGLLLGAVSSYLAVRRYLK
jgi:cell division transport system permease protein